MKNIWLEKILYERFGNILHIISTEERLEIRNKETDSAIVFDIFCDDFKKSHSNLSFTHWDAQAEGWHSILGSPLPTPGTSHLPAPLIEQQGQNYIIHYDILGLTYWMLTRQEEIGRTDLDNHGRFPAIASHAYKHGYLERPIVDEWLHILGQVIQRTWPNIQLKQHQFSMKVSHDVDNPSRYGFCSPKQLIRAIGGDIVKRRDFKSVLLAPWIRLNTKQTLHPTDPYNTFDWIMDVSEQHNLKSAFYFICGGDAPQDADYKLEYPAIRALMRRIHERGHEIGLHPSYHTYQNPERIVREANRLRKVCAEEGIEQQEWGGRMHFLRWEQPTTLHGWEQAGMSYDSTFSYADRPGFRCGTCFEYPAFDSLQNKILKLRVSPLIAMECSIIAKRYMALGYTEKTLAKFLDLKETCKTIKGNFNLLWHNSHFMTKKDKKLYMEIIK